jgi:hypothetical protein
LVDKMAHNTPHLLRFRKVYNNRWIIKFKENPHTCCLMKNKPKLLVHL